MWNVIWEKYRITVTWSRDDFLNGTQNCLPERKSQTIKINNFCLLKDTNKSEKQPTEEVDLQHVYSTKDSYLEYKTNTCKSILERPSTQ